MVFPSWTVRVNNGENRLNRCASETKTKSVSSVNRLSHDLERSPIPGSFFNNFNAPDETDCKDSWSCSSSLCFSLRLIEVSAARAAKPAKCKPFVVSGSLSGSYGCKPVLTSFSGAGITGSPSSSTFRLGHLLSHWTTPSSSLQNSISF